MYEYTEYTYNIVLNFNREKHLDDHRLGNWKQAVADFETSQSWFHVYLLIALPILLPATWGSIQESFEYIMAPVIQILSAPF